MKIFSILAAVLLLISAPLRAQVVEDGATATLDNVTNSISHDMMIGINGPFTTLIVTNGALLATTHNGMIGFNANSKSNRVWLTGANSRWATVGFYVGYTGAANQLVVSNGAMVGNALSRVGHNESSSNNLVVVTGAGSQWATANGLSLGVSGSGNQLVVTNGGVVRNKDCTVSFAESSSNNMVVVTGPNSLWTNLSLAVGYSGSGNQVVITDGGTVVVRTAAFLGVNPTSTDNRLVTDGGTLRAADVAFGLFEPRRGTNVLNAGTNEVDRLVMTNIAGGFEFNGGTLNVRTSTVNNGLVFTVGNGASAATYRMSGAPADRHNFANGLLISSSALLTGNGTVLGSVTVESGGKLSPGTSVGTVVFSNSPSLQGDIFMEISKNGIALTNDQVQVAGPLSYGGSLTISNLGPTPLTAGDRFQLFSATSYAGSFAPVTLPSLGGGHVWTNKLLLDGSIEVMTVAAPPTFSGVTVVGTNLVMTGTGGTPGADYVVLTATNIAQPLSSWARLVTNLFDLSGNFSFTNGIMPGELQRYFRFRTP